MRVTNLALIVILAIGVLFSGCSGSSGTSNPDNGGIQERERFAGPGMAAAPADNFELTEDGRFTSALYRKFFLDTVNHQSYGRWTVTNTNGPKTWVLSNTYNSSPKSWMMGGNYWNGDTDELDSIDFTIPAGTDGVRLSFFARWKTAAGDYCDVNYYVDGVGQLVTSFEGGQNPDYPSFTKYYFVLPANETMTDQDCSLEFWFDSNGSINDWGIAVDDVVVYQRGLEPPTNVDASDGNFSINVSWSHADTGTLEPDYTDIYRSLASGGPYEYQDSVAYPGTLWSDPTAFADTTYYYVLKATKFGWFNSADSAEDSGWYTFGGP